MLDYLDRLVQEKGLFKVLTFPIVVLGAVGGLGWLAGADEAPLIALAVLAATAVVLSAVSTLHAQRLGEEVKKVDEALTNLRRYTFNLHNPHVTLVKWRDEWTVGKGGDVTAVRRYTFRVEEGMPLHFVLLTAGGDALSDRERHRIRFEVRLEPGRGRVPIQVEWEGAGRAKIWAYLLTPLHPGSEDLTLVLTYAWPHTLAGLGGREGAQQSLRWHCLRDTLLLEYVIVLDKSHRRTDDLGYVLQGLKTAPKQHDEGGSWRIEGSAENLQKDEAVAISLDAS